jgi:ribosomal protein S4
MKNKIIQNKQLYQHELFIINKLKQLSTVYVSSTNKRKSISPFLLNTKGNLSCFSQMSIYPPLKKGVESSWKNGGFTPFKNGGELDFVQNQGKLIKNQEETNSLLSNTVNKKLTHSKWFYYIVCNNPINLLFSIDQFLFEFAKKRPQRRKSSEFQQQLKERKKLTIFYGHLSKKQLKNLVHQAQSSQGYFSLNFLSILERRLDVVLFRSGLVKNIITARQLISHKKIKVNNQILNTSSYQVNPGDIISLGTKKNEIISPLSEIISKKFKKRSLYNGVKKNGILTISPQFLYKLKNVKIFKNYKKKPTLKNFIRLLLSRVDGRAHLKIKKYIENIYFGFGFGLFLQSKKRIQSKKKMTESKKIHSKKQQNKKLCILKLKPLLSKQAKSFLLLCVQKNYLSWDRKPLFHNKYGRFINILEKNVSIYKYQNKYKKYHDNNDFVIFDQVKKIQSKKKSTVSFDTQKNNKSIQKDTQFSIKISKRQSISELKQLQSTNTTKFFEKNKNNAIKSFTRKLSNSSSIYYVDNKYSLQRYYFFKNSSIFNKKRIIAIYRNIVYKTLLQFHSYFVYFYDRLDNNTFIKKKNKNIHKKITNTLCTLKLKKHVMKKPSNKQIKRALRFCGKKPMHIEVFYNISTAIFLYSPQRLSYPFSLDVDLILRSFR